MITLRKLIFCLLLCFFSIPLFAQIKGSNGIVNVETGLSIRPYEAGNSTGNKIVMYKTIEWKCMTWEFEQTDGNTYSLKNLFTGKTFHPVDDPAKEGNSLEQLPLNKKDKTQLWEFIAADEGKYKIRLPGTDLYLTAANSKDSNSVITLEKDKKSTLQQWKLVPQSPKM